MEASRWDCPAERLCRLAGRRIIQGMATALTYSAEAAVEPYLPPPGLVRGATVRERVSVCEGRPALAGRSPLALCRTAGRLLTAIAVVAMLPHGHAAEQPRTVDVGKSIREQIEADWTEQDRRYSHLPPAAARPADERPAEVAATAVTTADDAAGGCDGVKTGRCGFHTASGEIDPWWQVDLGRAYRLDRVVVYNRTDGNTAPRTKRLRILAATDAASPKFEVVYEHDGETFYGVKENRPLVVRLADQAAAARSCVCRSPGGARSRWMRSKCIPRIRRSRTWRSASRPIRRASGRIPAATAGRRPRVPSRSPNHRSAGRPARRPGPSSRPRHRPSRWLTRATSSVAPSSWPTGCGPRRMPRV